MNSNDSCSSDQSSDESVEQEWQPTLSQLMGICEYYKLSANKTGTRAEIFQILMKNNVNMHYSSYAGNKFELRGAIVHWMEDPQISDSDSSDDFSRFQCAISDYDSDEVNDERLDTNVVDASLAIYEYCSPSHFDVQYEEEVEMVESMDIAHTFK